MEFFKPITIEEIVIFMISKDIISRYFKNAGSAEPLAVCGVEIVIFMISKDIISRYFKNAGSAEPLAVCGVFVLLRRCRRCLSSLIVNYSVTARKSSLSPPKRGELRKTYRRTPSLSDTFERNSLIS